MMPPQTLVGRVLSLSGQKTVKVAVTRIVQHPTVRKYVQRETRLLAHDETQALCVGDRVRVVQCRPVSRHKAFRVTELLEAMRPGTPLPSLRTYPARRHSLEPPRTNVVSGTPPGGTSAAARKKARKRRARR